MKRRISLLRIFTTTVLAVVLVPVSWGLSLFLTLGIDVARNVTPDTAAWVGSNERWIVAAVTDLAVWFGALWGLQNLWRELRTSLENRDTRLRPNHSERPRILGNALLLALPFSYFAAIGMSLLFKSGSQPWSPPLIVTFPLGLVFCTLAICILFILALKFWPRAVS